MSRSRRRSTARSAGTILLVLLLALAVWIYREHGTTANSPTATELRTVDRVIDGDTIDVTGSGGGEPQRIRVLGINTPEVAHQEDESAQCGGDEAAAQLEKLLPKGTDVVLVEDSRSDDEDRYGRLLRYVDTSDDHTDVGAQLIADGYAYAWKPTSAPRPDRWDDYEAATNEAQDSQAGSWETCPDLSGSK